MAAGDHRGTAAIRTLVEYAPATGGLALWMRHRDVAEGQIPGVIANDGLEVRYAPAFETLRRPQQVGWVAHQVLHVAFRHVQRRDTLRSLRGDVDDVLYNVCADAIVNSALSHLAWLELPTGAVGLDTLLARSLGIDEPVEKSLLGWDVESLYRAVDDRRERRGGRARRGQRQRAKEGGGGERAGDGTPQPTRQDGPRSAAARALGRGLARDLLPAPEQEAPEVAAENAREWAERIRRGHADDGAFSLLRTLVADVRESRVPWERLLRVSLARALSREPDLSWSRPARSWLANRGRSPTGRRLPWEPGTVASRAAPRLAVVLDVSGSIDDALLERLGTELRGITRRAEADGVLVVGDDAVREVRRMEPGAWTFEGLSCRGGGGTDFEPLLAEAARHRPDIAVVLTDLDGPAGPRPGFPVLWAAPARTLPPPAPFGRLVLLDA